MKRSKKKKRRRDNHMKPNHKNEIPLEAQYRFRQGLEMLNRQDNETAVKYFRQAILIAPGFCKAYDELGKCLEKMGRSGEAAVYREKASRLFC
jgi:tetratricopeptide (TPR) repeat protein